jgi:hypothetical protein
MRINKDYIFFVCASISLLLFILFFSFDSRTYKIDEENKLYSAQNSLLKTGHFTFKNSIIFKGNPVKEKSNTDNNSINLEEEIDFLDFHFLPNNLISIPIITMQCKIIIDDVFIELLHLELLVPPPKLI